MVRLSCSVSLGTNFYRSPKRNCRGVSMGVDLGLAFCPGAMGLDTSGHRAPGRRIGLGSSPWFPGVSLPSCAKPNKLLNNHECWVLFLKGHESLFIVSPTFFSTSPILGSWGLSIHRGSAGYWGQWWWSDIMVKSIKSVTGLNAILIHNQTSHKLITQRYIVMEETFKSTLVTHYRNI